MTEVPEGLGPLGSQKLLEPNTHAGRMSAKDLVEALVPYQISWPMAGQGPNYTSGHRGPGRVLWS